VAKKERFQTFEICIQNKVPTSPIFFRQCLASQFFVNIFRFKMSFITQRSSFTSKEMRLLQDLDIQVYYKTYKVIYRLGWKVTIMRAQMANGDKFYWS